MKIQTICFQVILFALLLLAIKFAITAICNIGGCIHQKISNCYFHLMIKVRIKEIAAQFNINNAYQLQNFTGFYPSKSANLWKGEWQLADLDTLNTLCNLFKCTPNDLLEYTPDPEEN